MAAENPAQTDGPPATLILAFHGRVIDHLGIQMYQSPIAAVAELVANAWDANAESVGINFPKKIEASAEIVIADNGHGMTFEECQLRFLDVGRDRRQGDAVEVTEGKKRPVLGRKGIGKFAGFGIAQLIDITTISAKNGEKTRFALDLGKLRGDSYHAAKPAKVDVLEYEPPDEGRRAEHGTTIRLKRLTLKQAPSPKVQAEGLARRFLLHQRAADFAVKVNGDDLPTADSTEKIEFSFPKDFETKDLPKGVTVAADGFGEEELAPGQALRWKIVFYEDTISDSELQGVSVFVGGKLAQAPFMFEFSGGTTAQAGQPYLSGRVEADFLDQQGEDLIATERQRINWQHESTTPLLEWGQERIKQALAAWGRKRVASKIQFLNEKISPFKKRVDRLQTHERKVVRSALEKIAGITKLTNEQFLALSESMLVAWENGRLKELISTVADARDLSDDALIDILIEANVLTALATAEAVKTKLLVIEGLKQRIEKKELENSLRDYIGENPWLLGPEWETYKVETSPTNLLKEARKTAGLDDPESWPGRLDLALRAGTTLMIVEFMRPGITLDNDHLARWETYIRIVRSEIGAQTALGFESADGYLIADKVAKKPYITDKIKSLKTEGMRVMDWPSLLARAAGEWKDYFRILVGRGPDDDRLRALAAELNLKVPEQLAAGGDGGAPDEAQEVAAPAVPIAPPAAGGNA